MTFQRGDKVSYNSYKTPFTVLAETYGGERVWVIEELVNGLIWNGTTGELLGFTPRLLPTNQLKLVK
jgi:hypothetical protein